MEPKFSSESRWCDFMNLTDFYWMFEKRPKQQKLVHDKVRTFLKFAIVVEALITESNTYLSPSVV
jgi:hypothetical protein